MKSATITDLTPHLVRRRIFEQVAKQNGTVDTLQQLQERIENLLSHSRMLSLKYFGRNCEQLQCEFAAMALMPLMSEIKSHYAIENALLALLRSWNNGLGRRADITITAGMAIEIIPSSEANENLTLRYTALGTDRLYTLISGENEISLMPADEPSK